MDTSPLISAEQLADELDNSSFKVFDIRGTWGNPPESVKNRYLEGHIPGSLFLDWTKHFIDTSKPIPLAPAPSVNDARNSFAHFGITGDEKVVLYDDYANMFASRLWWVLRYLGHPYVQILDGGWECWTANNFAIDTAESTPVSIPIEAAFEPIVQAQLHADIKAVDSILGNGILIDGRGEAGFNGTKSDPRSGHIPGAINIPFRSLLASNNQFKSPDDLKAEFANHSVTLHDDIITSCGSGYSATVVSVALKVLGKDVPMYDDSFSVWKQDPSRKVEQS